VKIDDCIARRPRAGICESHHHGFLGTHHGVLLWERIMVYSTVF